MANISKRDIIRYKMLNNFLDVVCQTYFEQNCENWQRFVSWSFHGNDDIVITYAYEDYYNPDLNTEYGEEIVSIDKILEIGNELYADYLEGTDSLESEEEWVQKIKEENETENQR